MASGIIYIMKTAVDGLIKIGKTDNFEKRMCELERNGYHNVVGLKRAFAIKVQNYDQKEEMLHNIFSKSQVGNSELFTLDVDLAKQVLSSLEGDIIYPKENKQEIFIEATDSVEEKGLEISRHHFKDIDFSSSLTNKKYHGKTSESGVLAIIEVVSGIEVPNNSNPSKKAIIGRAIEDLGGSITKDETLYQRYRKLTKMVLKE